jgi:DNA repair protein RadA/Sms
LPADAVYFGEISLSGAIRPVAQAAARLKEAQKLGFARAIAPEAARSEGGNESGLSLQSVSSLASLVADIAARGTRPARADRRAVGES